MPIPLSRVIALVAGTAAASAVISVIATMALLDHPTASHPAPAGRTGGRHSTPATALGPGGLTADQRRRADELISTFENSTAAIRYDYAKNLHDGRGVTAGRAGFTTANGDALEVVRHYTDEVPDNPLAKFIPTLKRLAHETSDETGSLPERDYGNAWKKAAKDPEFRQAQDQVSDRLYFTPAMAVADRVGLHTALARAELYDAIIQHGGGSDPDGLSALVRRTSHQVRGTPASGMDERRWLGVFFKVRIHDLMHPYDQSTQAEWSDSVDRVHAIQRIAAHGNYGLNGPIDMTVYGDEYTIK